MTLNRPHSTPTTETEDIIHLKPLSYLNVTVVDRKKVVLISIALIARGIFETFGLGLLFLIPDLVYHGLTSPEERFLINMKHITLPNPIKILDSGEIQTAEV